MLDIFAILNNSNNFVVLKQIIVYSEYMANDKDKMNKYEIVLNEQLGKIMKQEEVNFSVFLPVLVDYVPPKSEPEYFKILKKEQMKYRRGSLSVEELHKMLNIIGWDFYLELDGKSIDIVKYSLDDKVRFTDLMRVCELLNIKINFKKQ